MAAPRRRRTTKSPVLRARYAKRRKNRLAKVDNDLTPGQWEALLTAWGEACAYCGDAESALQKDCVQPVSRHGRYTLTNVVPACRSCNASKGNDEVTSWMRPKKLDEAVFLMRHATILSELDSHQES